MGDCTVINSQRYFDPRVIFLVGAILSYLCYGYILYLRFVIKLPSLSRHPTGIFHNTTHENHQFTVSVFRAFRVQGSL